MGYTKPLFQKYICFPMFISALFTVTKVGKQPEYPWIDERIKKKKYPQYAHIHDGILFSIKKKETCNNMVGPGRH